MVTLAAIRVHGANVQHPAGGLPAKVGKCGLDQKERRLQVDSNGSVEEFVVSLLDAPPGNRGSIVHQPVDSSKVVDSRGNELCRYQRILQRPDHEAGLTPNL